jgi:hypothetical protein
LIFIIFMRLLKIMRQTFLATLVLLGHVSVAIGDPKPYSADRYSVIWHESFVFEKSTRSSGTDPTENEWDLAGVFAFGAEEGAIVVNRSNGSIEYLNTSSPSPSGMTLRHISPTETAQNPRIEVIQRGKLLTLPSSASPSNNVALKYIPSTTVPATATVALTENR